MPRNIKIGLLGIVVSIFALVFITKQINLDLFAQAWSGARYIYILPCVGLLIIALIPRALRWQVLLNGGLPLSRTFHIMNIAYFVNGVLPLRMGEFARMYLASQGEPSVPVLQTASTIVVERLLDLSAVVVMMSMVLIVGPVPDSLQAVGLFFGGASLVGFIMLILLAKKRELVQRLVGTLITRIPIARKFNLSRWLDELLDGVMPLTQWNSLVQLFLWTVIGWGLSLFAGYILMFAFFDDASWMATALYIAAAAFAIALPAVPLNLGTYEASILLALTTLGYEQSEAAVAFAVMVHAANVFVHAATGLIGFLHEGISLGQLSSGVQRLQQREDLAVNGESSV